MFRISYLAFLVS